MRAKYVQRRGKQATRSRNFGCSQESKTNVLLDRDGVWRFRSQPPEDILRQKRVVLGGAKKGLYWRI